MARHPRILVSALSIVLFAAACGGSSTPSGGGASSSSTQSSSTGGAPPVSVTLKHVPHGQATLAFDAASKTLTVEVKLVGLAPNSGHPEHIHTGSCSSQGGVIYPLNAIMADAHGVADTMTTVSNVKEPAIPASGWYLNIHNGPGLMPDEQFLPIVCGDVSNPSGGSNVTVPLTMGPPSLPGSPDQRASGTATLSIENGSLKVVLDVTGLAPGSAHAVHIHSGSCENRGAILYPLDPLAADSTGHATETKVVANVAAISSGLWYIDIHRLTTIATGSTAYDPILCGNVG